MTLCYGVAIHFVLNWGQYATFLRERLTASGKSMKEKHVGEAGEGTEGVSKLSQERWEGIELHLGLLML